jgi:hypothetical protein
VFAIARASVSARARRLRHATAAGVSLIVAVVACEVNHSRLPLLLQRRPLFG